MAQIPIPRTEGTVEAGRPYPPAGACRSRRKRYRGDRAVACGEPCADDTRTCVRIAPDRRRLTRCAPSMGVHPQNPRGRPVAGEGSADPQAPPLVGRPGPPPDTWTIRRADSVARGPGVFHPLPASDAGGMGESGEGLTPTAAGKAGSELWSPRPKLGAGFLARGVTSDRTLHRSGRGLKSPNAGTIRSTSRSSSATRMRRSRSVSTSVR